MTLVNNVGMIALQHDPIRLSGVAPAFVGTGVMDASAEKVGVVGCVWHPTVHTGTINIRKVHFRCGTSTLSALSAIQVSLQNVSLTAGPPYQPDGTPDQTAALTTITSAALNSTGNLSADRSVDLSADSPGDANSRWLAVVFEYTTFTALDSVIISGSGTADLIAGHQLGSALGLFTASAWSVLAATAAVFFECDDGTFAFLEGCMPFITYSSANVSSTGAIRRAGVKLRFPVEVKISKLALMCSLVNGCDGRFVLYDSDGTTELVSVDVDNDAVYAAGDIAMAVIRFAPVTLVANTFYRFAFVGGTSNVCTVYYGDINAAGHMDGLYMGQNAIWTQADSAGTWTDTTTRRPHFGAGVAAMHDGSGGGVSFIDTRRNMMIGR